MRIIGFVLLLTVAVSLPSCRRKDSGGPPLATPSIALSRDKAPLGSPIDVSYRFDVDPAASFGEDYTAFVHLIDSGKALVWTDDHALPTPTTQWKPGQRLEYTRTVFLPAQARLGNATLQMGLYSRQSQKRVVLQGEDMGQRAYKVATLELLPESLNLFTSFAEGWHTPENTRNQQNEWQWTKQQEATLRFKNPRGDCLFYFDLDNPSNAFPDGQHVQVKLGSHVIDDFRLEPAHRVFRKTSIMAGELGLEDVVTLQIAVDKTFVPAQLSPPAADKRELGIRVFHAFIEPKR